MSAVTTKCAHFLIRKGSCDWKHALERQRRHEQGRSQDFSKGGAEVMEAKALKRKNCL